METDQTRLWSDTAGLPGGQFVRPTSTCGRETARADVSVGKITVKRHWRFGDDVYVVADGYGHVYGGSLTAYDCKRDECLRVPAQETYQQCSDDRVLDV